MEESGRVTACFARLETTFNFKPFIDGRSDDYILDASPKVPGRVSLRRIAFWILSFRSLVGDICRRIIRLRDRPHSLSAVPTISQNALSGNSTDDPVLHTEMGIGRECGGVERRRGEEGTAIGWGTRVSIRLYLHRHKHGP